MAADNTVQSGGVIIGGVSVEDQMEIMDQFVFNAVNGKMMEFCATHNRHTGDAMIAMMARWIEIRGLSPVFAKYKKIFQEKYKKAVESGQEKKAN